MRRAARVAATVLCVAIGSPVARGEQAALSPVEQRLAAVEAELAEQKAALAAVLGGDPGSEASDPAGEGQKLHIYGFLDAGLQRYFVADETKHAQYPSTATTFASGNSNIYIEARPMRGWRGLTETRLTLLPHGDLIFRGLGDAARANNTVTDASSPSGRNLETWGSIVVERAFIEWTMNEKLALQVGLFLTPWGIWNVDHGTPTLISLLLPSFIVQEAVPRRQTGMQLLGALTHGDYELGYRVFVSNGRTTTLIDFTDDKALGGRLYLRRFGALNATLGSSFYTGTANDVVKSVNLSPSTGKIVLSERTPWSFSEWAGGVDLAMDWRGVRVRTEGVVRHVQHDDGKHKPSFSLPGEFEPNRYEWFGYVILAYRVRPWLEPYLYGEVMDTGMTSQFFPDQGSARSAGLNIYFNPNTQLKVQYSDVTFKNLSGDNRAGYATSRLVLVF